MTENASLPADKWRCQCVWNPEQFPPGYCPADWTRPLNDPKTADDVPEWLDLWIARLEGCPDEQFPYFASERWDRFEGIVAQAAPVSKAFPTRPPKGSPRGRFLAWLKRLRALFTTRGKRRAAKPRKPRPLTARQAEVVQVVGECKGNVALAARRLGRDRKTIEQSYRTALTTLGKVAVKHGERLFPRDRRGQAALSDSDDKRRQ